MGYKNIEQEIQELKVNKERKRRKPIGGKQ